MTPAEYEAWLEVNTQHGLRAAAKSPCVDCTEEYQRVMSSGPLNLCDGQPGLDLNEDRMARVRAAQQLYAAGMTMAAISRRMGLSQSAVGNYIRGRGGSLREAKMAAAAARRAKVMDLWYQGAPVVDIARITGVSDTQVKRDLKRVGLGVPLLLSRQAVA